MRTTKDRDRLEEAENSNGCPLVQEVGHRLNLPFRLEDALAGREIALLCQMMVAVAGLIEAKIGHKWQEDYETYLAVEQAWQQLWHQFDPKLNLRLDL